jgi:hypothetical protein
MSIWSLRGPAPTRPRRLPRPHKRQFERKRIRRPDSAKPTADGDAREGVAGGFPHRPNLKFFARRESGRQNRMNRPVRRNGRIGKIGVNVRRRPLGASAPAA